MTPELLSVEYLDHLFTHHPPNTEQIGKYNRLREAAKAFAVVVATECDPSADRSTAIRKIREAVMTANAAIALQR